MMKMKMMARGLNFHADTLERAQRNVQTHLPRFRTETTASTAGALQRGAFVKLGGKTCGRVLESGRQTDAEQCVRSYTVCIVEHSSGAMPEFTIERVGSDALSALEQGLLESLQRCATGTILKTESTVRRGLDGQHVKLVAVEPAAEGESYLDRVVVSCGTERMTISALEFLPDDIASSESHQVAAAHHEAENSESRVPVHLLLARPAQIQLKSSHIAKSYGVSCEEGIALVTPQLQIPCLIDGKFIKVDVDHIVWPESLRAHLPFEHIRAKLALGYYGGTFTDAACPPDTADACSIPHGWGSWYRYQGI